MENGLMLLFLVLNFGISFWNAFVSGAYFTETKIMGGWARLTTWCGLTMSAAGFTWVYTTLMALIAVKTGHLDPEWGEIMLKIGYLVVILPVIGSGLGIWVNSLAVAYRERNFGSVAVAAWNTYAMADNTWHAARNAPNFLDDVAHGFSKSRRSSKDSAAAVLVIVLVIIAIFGGIITTGLIARWADRKIAIHVTRMPRDK